MNALMQLHPCKHAIRLKPGESFHVRMRVPVRVYMALVKYSGTPLTDNEWKSLLASGAPKPL